MKYNAYSYHLVSLPWLRLSHLRFYLPMPWHHQSKCQHSEKGRYHLVLWVSRYYNENSRPSKGFCILLSRTRFYHFIPHSPYLLPGNKPPKKLLAWNNNLFPLIILWISLLHKGDFYLRFLMQLRSTARTESSTAFLPVFIRVHQRNHYNMYSYI